MSKVIGFLFPWRNTFRRLELEKRWWHRLATVLFFVALSPTFLFSWVIGNEENAPVYSFEQNIHHWGGGADGLLFDLDSIQPLDGATPPTLPPATIQKTIEMPDGNTAAYPGATSDGTIMAEWRHNLHMAEIQAAWRGFGIAVLVTVLFSYLLQASYRALLYVIYGAKARRAPNNPEG